MLRNDHKVGKIVPGSLTSVNIFDQTVISPSKVRRNKIMSYRNSVTKIKETNQNINTLHF